MLQRNLKAIENFARAKSQCTKLLDWTSSQNQGQSFLPLSKELLEFLESSGWNDVIIELLTSSPVKVLTKMVCQNQLILPVYIDQIQYYCLSVNDAQAAKISLVDIPNVAKVRLLAVGDKIKYLVDTEYDIVGPAFTGTDAPSGAKVELVDLENPFRFFDTLVRALIALSDYGFDVNMRDIYLTVSGEALIIYTRYYRQSVSFWSNMGMVFDILSKYQNFPGKDTILKRVNEYRQFTIKPSKTLNEFKIDEVSSVDIDGNQLTTLVHMINHNQFDSSTKLVYLDMTMCLISKRVMPKTLEDIYHMYMKNISVFGYIRTGLGYFGGEKMLQFFVSAPWKLYEYQKIRNEYMHEANGFDTNIGAKEIKYIELNEPILQRGFKIVNERKGNISDYLNHWLDMSEPDIVNTIDLLNKVLPGSSITISGIQLSREALIRTFYNTPLETIAGLDNDELDAPVWLTLNDLELIRDLLEGKIMIYVLYAGLSESAFVNLSGKNTFLDAYDWVKIRTLLDRYFVVNKPFIDQFSIDLTEKTKEYMVYTPVATFFEIMQYSPLNITI